MRVLAEEIKIVTTISEMQDLADRWRLENKIIGLVPTMGYLHEGHLSLIRIANERADVVVTSIFVNPTQFGPNEDLDSYPRNLERDTRLAKEAGCDHIFVPDIGEMYPEGYQTFVQVEQLTRGLCGASRPTHFRGVTTVVSKLFNIVKPHLAVFGQKDAQQALVIKRMVRDLNFDVDVIIAPIVRHADGLAMSSRNEYLTPEERGQALVLSRALSLAQKLVDDGERDVRPIREAMNKLIAGQPAARVDYIEIVDAVNLEPAEKISGQILVAVAVFIGKARLIDNIILTVPK